jgi:hypothetical protein
MIDNDSQAATQVPITVTFDATQPEGSRFTWSPNAPPVVASLPVVTNGSSSYALVFTLVSPNSPGAVWSAAPMSWRDGDPPPPADADSIMPSPGANQFMVGVKNTNQRNEPEKFGFKVSVDYNGSAFTSPDPEVVLQPPS